MYVCRTQEPISIAQQYTGGIMGIQFNHSTAIN